MSSDIELHVVPADGVTERYAAASGDDNPIHVDEAFARSVGLPGRILHGLWTAAQVARAAVLPAPDGPVVGSGSGARYALESLSVQFRGMGAIGAEVVIAGAAGDPDPDDGSVEVSLGASQDGTRLVRNAKARLRPSSGVS